ncbi:uncharacterized protein TRIADDRAFT_24251, partial [Trichoplax adhaerens]
IACKIVAISMHYLFLAAFCWMLAEGLHLYMQIVAVFHQKDKIWMYYIIGWGIPAVIVGVATAIRYDNYGVNNTCWLSTANGLIWAFVGPLILVISINGIIALIVIRITLIKSASSNMVDHKESEKLRQIKTATKGFAILFPILGLTWIFGIFSTDKYSILFSYIFVILNSSQGCFIFIFHCLMNSEVCTPGKTLY